MADTENQKPAAPDAEDGADAALLSAVDQAPGPATPDAVIDARAAEAAPIPPPAAAPKPAVPPPAPRRGGFFPALLGGAVAAAAGFAASHYNLIPLGASGDAAAIEARLTGQATEAAALKAELQRLSARPSVEPALADRIAALEAALTAAQAGGMAGAPVDLAPLEGRIAALEDRLTAIESLPAGAGGASSAALAALQAEVAGLKGGDSAVGADLTRAAAEAEARIAEAEASAKALKDEAEALARTAAARAALGQMQAAVESGAPFVSALGALDPASIPPELTALAETGVPTRAAVAEAFPDAARAALAAALQADMGDTWGERVGSFIRSQTGARPLTPQDGTTPDAILSRAEAALQAGDLTAALTEVDSLPDPAKAAMAPWADLARQRQGAEAALTALAATVGQ